MMFEGVAMEHIVEYFLGIIKVILSVFGVQLDDETTNNLGDIFDNIMDYQPEV